MNQFVNNFDTDVEKYCHDQGVPDNISIGAIREELKRRMAFVGVPDSELTIKHPCFQNMIAEFKKLRPKFCQCCGKPL